MAARPRVEHSYYVGRIGKNWVGYWYVRDEADARLKRQRVIGPRKTMTKTEAEERHGAWIRENVPAYGAIPEKPTVLTLWERHIAQMRDLLSKGKRHPKYVGSLPSLFEYLRPLAAREVSTIKPEEIEPLFDAMLSPKSGEAPSNETKNHIRSLLRTLLSDGGNDALKKSKMRLAGRRKGETLGVDQIRSIRAKLAGRDLVIFDVFAFAGLRAGEARRIARVHLSLPGVLETPGTKTVFAGLPIPVPADLHARLLQLPSITEDEPILFEQESHRTWLEEVLQPAAKACGIDKIDTRMLRRTVLTMMRKEDKGAASRLARHSDSSMMDTVYDNADLDRVRQAQDAIFAEVTSPRKMN